MNLYLFYYLLIINVVTFLVSGLDKRAARLHKRRVPEKKLFKLAMAGGALGLYLSMFAFHHKTKHGSFMVGVPGIILLQTFIFVYWKFYR